MLRRILLALFVLLLIAPVALACDPVGVRSAGGIEVVGHSTTTVTRTTAAATYQPAVMYYSPGKAYQSHSEYRSYSYRESGYAKQEYRQERRFAGDRRPVRRLVGLPLRLFGRLCGR